MSPEAAPRPILAPCRATTLADRRVRLSGGRRGACHRTVRLWRLGVQPLRLSHPSPVDLLRARLRTAVGLRILPALCLASLLIVAAPQATATGAKVRGPWRLVSLASLGTVTWRCDPNRHPGLASGLPGLALGFSSSALQSGVIHLRVGGRTIVTRRIPASPINLRYLHKRVQRLDIQVGGENGTLRAFVVVDFAAGATSGYCWPYTPPKTEVRLFPRR